MKAGKIYNKLKGRGEKIFHCNIIRDSSGEGYIDLIIIMLVSICLIYCFVSIVPYFIKNQNLSHMAESLARTIEITGSKGHEFEAELSRLKSESGMNPTVEISGDFDGDKLQLRKKFRITLTEYIHIKLVDPSFAPPVVLKIPIVKKVTGMSEVYWKS